MNHSSLIYDKPDANSLSELPAETKKIIEWVGTGNEILEFGCHTGHLAQWLGKSNNNITGVDINIEALKKAEKYLHTAIQGDIEQDVTWDKIGPEQFDFILFMHILEHLRDPLACLEKATPLLKNNGQIIIGLPNISNAKNRLDIFRGNFEYTEIGVMDRTHLRFFNYQTAVSLIEEAGLEITEYFSPWKVNPLFVLFDHLPVLNRVKQLFVKDKPPFLFRNKPNLTDVVMMFKCRKKLK